MKKQCHKSYITYLSTYNLPETEETRQDWLFNEWNHGRLFQYDGKFFDIYSGEEVK